MRRFAFLILLILLAGCAAIRPQAASIKIMVLAPFEGTYAEIGYGALYPARLAFAEQTHAHQRIELIFVDDGGLVETAVYRARAAKNDASIYAVIVLGYAATHPDVLAEFGETPVLIVGDWGAEPTPNSYHLSHAEIALQVNNPRMELAEAILADAPTTGGEIYGLEAFRRLRPLEDITLITSGALADEDFTQQILASDMYASPPHHLSTLVYDAIGLALASIETDTPFNIIRYEGLNGVFTFTDGRWTDAPIFNYRYMADGQLINHPIE